MEHKNTIKLYNDDCLKIMPLLDDESIDMILCDLPYGMTDCDWDSPLPVEELWQQYKRVTKIDSPIVLTGSQPFTSSLVMSNPKMFRSEWIWEKDNGSNFMNVKKHPFKVHENILIFAKKTAKYFPQMTPGKPYRTKQGGCPEFINITRKITTLNTGTRYPRSIIKCNSEKGYHPTQKPTKLFEYLIKTYSEENDTVLDNCMGSGTSAVAAKRLNRNYIGIEKEKKYFDIAKQRVLSTKWGESICH